MLSFGVSLAITASLLLLIIVLSYLFLSKLSKGLTMPHETNSNNANENTQNINQDHSNLEGNQPTLYNPQQQPQNIHQPPADFDPNRKLTKKEQQKMLKRHEKVEKREYQKQLLEAKKFRDQEKEKELKVHEQQKEIERLKLEEALKRVKEEQEKKENDIYDQWKDKIKIGDEGEDRNDFEKEEVIKEFINYIKLRKVVSLEDLSGQFKMSSNELVEKLNKFECEGRILGIIDDRGKYIYITEKEMCMIEKMFATRGRISKSDLIKECNRIIKFEPSEEDKIKIAEEQKKMLFKYEEELK